MEPRIQYAKTSDGVSIAFWTLGEGPATVIPSPLGWSHAQLERQIPGERQFADRMAEWTTFVRYDARGTGLSEREVTDFSLDSLLLDLEAVVDRLGLERFSLLAPLFAGPVSIAYTARHPERVSRFLLWCSYARAADFRMSPQVLAVFKLIDDDWNLFTETLAHVFGGWERGEDARRLAAYQRESITAEKFKAWMAAQLRLDATDLLPRIRCPTLVVHRREWRPVAVDVARRLASRIPDARLVVLEGDQVAPYYGDFEGAMSVIREFLDEGEEAAAEAEPPDAGAFRTVLFTDVEGSTALTQRLGDARARDVLRGHERMVREALKSHGGSEVKTMGDGFMASFGSATKALECAIAMQRAFAAHNESAAEPIRVRVGLNAGEPIAEDEDLFGTAVILAARIAAQAQGGEVLASNVVRELVAGKEFLFADRGDTVLRGFEDPVRLYELRWREDG